MIELRPRLQRTPFRVYIYIYICICTAGYSFALFPSDERALLETEADDRLRYTTANLSCFRSREKGMKERSSLYVIRYNVIVEGLDNYLDNYFVGEE